MQPVEALRGFGVVCSNMNQVDRIVGELMQPGGIRALEAMGIADCAKCAEIDGVMVDGYACIMPGTAACEDLVLTYPQHDPTSLTEHFGVLDKDSRAVKVNATHAGVAPAPLSGTTGTGTSTGVCPANGDDLQPRGRSFHNHRFVHELRQRAHAEKNVTVRTTLTPTGFQWCVA